MITKMLTDFIFETFVWVDKFEPPTFMQLNEMQAYIELALLTATEEDKKK